MSLHRKTVSGVLWNFAQRLSTSGIGFFITLLLARYLAPADFGLIAMMVVFIAVATSLMDSGFTQALIRKVNADAADYATAFLANLVLGLLAYALLFAGAPLISEFYGEPELVNLLRVAGLVVPVNSTMMVQVAILSRRLDFKAQLHVTVPATLLSGVISVGLAYVGWGAWALVLQMLIAAVVTSALYWMSGVWRPQWSFSYRSLAEMYGFGSKLFIAGLIDTLFQNMYVVVIARLFSAVVAGHYFFANKIKDVILSQLVVAIQAATYPALASVQHDDVRLKAGYRQVIQLTVFALFPALLFTAALARPLFEVLVPEKWIPAVPYLRLLCIAGLLYPLHAINLEILKVKGRSDLFLYLDVLKKAVFVGVLALSYRYGVMGILYGQVICSVLAYVPNSYFSSRLVNYPIREQCSDFVPALLLAAIVAGVAHACSSRLDLPPLAVLLLVGFAAGTAYIALAAWMRMPAIKLCFELIRNRRVSLQSDARP